VDNYCYHPIFPQKRGGTPKAPRCEKFREFLATTAKILNSKALLQERAFSNSKIFKRRLRSKFFSLNFSMLGKLYCLLAK
jgi:hypothetical protein